MTDRYARQSLFQPIGPGGREKIKSASVVVTGCGALGSAAAEILARSGIGRLRIVDRDIVRLSHLPGQSLFTEKDARDAVPRASAAAAAISLFNSEIRVEGLAAHIDSSNIEELCGGFDVLVDGLDNFETRFLVNEFSVVMDIPWVYGSVLGSSGKSRMIVPGKTPCLKCLFPDDPAPGSRGTLETSGLINPVIHAIASFQVTQILKLIVNGEGSREKLDIDLWGGDWQIEDNAEKPAADCPCCRKRDFPYLEGRLADRVTSLCGPDSVQIFPAVRGKLLNLFELAGRYEKENILKCNDYLLQAHIEDYEFTVFSNGRAIIKGVKDHVEARILYSRFIGN
ncbi:MAG: ThiF family adenylyltransferase [Anaerolineales bacterium]|nr:ThiF family adenylyltransferase [Anaerolineales bacterium]